MPLKVGLEPGCGTPALQRGRCQAHSAQYERSINRASRRVYDSRRWRLLRRLHVKSGAWYGRWWIDGRRVNRKLGAIREPGCREGLTKREAEADGARRLQDDLDLRGLLP
jgi:hypothetical protein